MTSAPQLTLPRKFIRRLRQGDIRNTLYLTYYHSYLYVRDQRLGTEFAGSSLASDLGGSDQRSTGNFPAHPRITRRLLLAIPDHESLSLIDVGCGSGAVMHVALDMGFAKVDGIELLPQAAAIARSNLDDPRTEVKVGDALKVDFSGYDVMTLFNPFPMREEYQPLITRSNPQWLLLMNLESIKPDGYAVVRSYRHPIYKPFTGRLLKRLP